MKSKSKSIRSRGSSRKSRTHSEKENKPIARAVGMKNRTGTFEMANIELKCNACKKNIFKERRIQLQQRWKNFIGEQSNGPNILGLLNQRASVMRCCNCSYCMWFNVRPTMTQDINVKDCFESGY
jgi:hypothetical protein